MNRPITLLLFTLFLVPVTRGQQLLPDLIVRLDELYDHEIVPAGFEPRKLILSNGTANVGEGKLYLYGVEPGNGATEQPVMQRVFNVDGSHEDQLAGYFIYHPQHGHIHFQNWSVYRLRGITTEGGIGDIVASSQKTSFCILDTDIQDPALPGFVPFPYFVLCDYSIQGLSVGWYDVYTKDLPGQSIFIDGVPNGIYWLESEVDPMDDVLESDETNNIARIQVVIGSPGTLVPDRFEPNENTSSVSSRDVGAPNSPNLGPCGPIVTLQGESIHSSSDVDLFRFYLPSQGAADDSIRIDFNESLGDLVLQLLNSNGTVLAESSESGNWERLSLENRPAGWYYVRVSSASGATNPYYALTIDPSENTPPSISITDPPVGTHIRIHGFETYTAQWTYSDAESNQCWVTLYADSTPSSTGDEILFPSSVNTAAAQGLYVINSAYVPEGTYGIFATITDGGSWSEGSSLGNVQFVICPYRPGDANGDGSGPNIVDISYLVGYLFLGGPLPPDFGAGDADGSGRISVLDITYLVKYLFKGGATPVCGS